MPGGPNQDAISQSSDMSEYQQTSISLLRAQLKVRPNAKSFLNLRDFLSVIEAFDHHSTSYPFL